MSYRNNNNYYSRPEEMKLCEKYKQLAEDKKDNFIKRFFKNITKNIIK
jgi:hypothetical protein